MPVRRGTSASGPGPPSAGSPRGRPYPCGSASGSSSVFGGVAIASLILFRNAGTYLPQNAVWAASVYPPGPSWAHPFGVLHGIVGIDLLQAMVRATPWDLAIVGAILLLALSIGLLLGGIAGGSGSTTTDIVVTSWTDAIAGVPPFFLVFVVFLPIATLVPVAWSLPVFVLSFGFVLWPYHARLVRAQAREVREEPFVESARASGSGRWSIVRRHILPNSYRAVLTQVPADVASIFFVLTVFPFAHCFDSDPRLGDYLFPLLTPLPNPGPSYPAPFFPEWGNLLAQGVCFGYQIFLALQSVVALLLPAPHHRGVRGRRVPVLRRAPSSGPTLIALGRRSG